MAIKSSGFTLLIAMIFVGVILAFAVTLGALGYKQSILASDATQSQFAFYAADSALECALYADQKQYPSPVWYDPSDPTTNAIQCQGVTTPLTTLCYSPQPPGTAATCLGNTNEWISTARIPIDASSPTPRCADLTFYEPKNRAGVYIFSEGYNISCATLNALGPNDPTRVVARGIQAQY